MPPVDETKATLMKISEANALGLDHVIFKDETGI
jgi:hypothetical protein